MSEVPGRVRRAFADHGSFEQVSEATYTSASTPFDTTVTVDGEDGHIAFELEVRLPTLSAVVDGDVADVVEEGWYETFELRIADVNGVTRGDHDLAPAVEQDGAHIVVTVAFTDISERRGVDDLSAVLTYVEGTYVQGIIPGYDYTEPVTSLMSSAQEMGGF